MNPPLQFATLDETLHALGLLTVPRIHGVRLDVAIVGRNEDEAPPLVAPVPAPPPGAISGQGLRLEDIEADSTQAALLQRGKQILLVDQRSPRGIHQDGAGLHLLEFLARHDTARAGREHVVHAQHVGGAEQLLLRRRDLEASLGETAGFGGFIGFLLCQAGAPREHVHAEAQLARHGGLRAESAQAQQAQGLAAQRRHQARLPALPVRAGRDVGVPADDVLRQSQDQRPGLLVRRVVTLHRVGLALRPHHRDAQLGRRRDVDRRVAHPRRHQQLEIRQLAEHRPRELRAFTHRRYDREGLQPRNQLRMLGLDFRVQRRWEAVDFEAGVGCLEWFEVT